MTRRVNIPITVGFNMAQPPIGFASFTEPDSIPWETMGLAPAFDAETGELLELSIVPRDQMMPPVKSKKVRE